MDNWTLKLNKYNIKKKGIKNNKTKIARESEDSLLYATAVG